MTKRIQNLTFVAVFSVVVCLIFWKILTLRAAFLYGDYLQQLYPWSYLYSDGIKRLVLPLWTRYVGSGFPILAEGQIGGLYPINFIFFFLLPFKMAYNYLFLFHFILSGFFTYLLAREKGADFWGGALSGILICFGSMYAGCFIHIAALRALVWFPLAILLIDRYLDGKNNKLILVIGLISGIQMLSGSAQMAVYSIGFSFLYLLYRSFEKKRSPLRSILEISAIGAVAFLIAMPQILSTFKLTQYSNRLTIMNPEFALWGSFSPAALIALIIPSLGKVLSKGNIIYISVLGLFFSLIGIFLSREKKGLRPFVIILIVAVFFALGKYNPAYIFLIKIFRFYSFRAPSRLIYFGVFSLSILSGVGFTYFTKNIQNVPKVIYRVFNTILMAGIGVVATSNVIFHFFGSKILFFAKEYVEKNIYGKSFHRHSLDFYMDKTESLYIAIKELISFQNPYMLSSIILIVIALGFTFIFKRAKKVGSVIKVGCLVFICVELFIFSLYSRGMRGEIKDFDIVEPQETKVFNYLKNDKSLFRVCPFGKFKDIPLWLRPSMNAVYGIDSVSIYSPLVNRDYFNAMEGLGTVDDSIGIIDSSKEMLFQKIDLLKKLNVKYIASTAELRHSLLEYVMKDKSLFLYEVKNYLPRAYFSYSLDAIKPIKGSVDIKKYVSGKAEIEVENKKEGFLIFSEKFYPGWKAYVDGKEVEIFRASEILQAVKLSTGKHKVVFKYKPKLI